MAFKVKVQEIVKEFVKRGKGGYSVLTVNYLYGTEARTQKVMSFSNPQVFATLEAVQKGQTIEVDVTKNDKGYNEWARVQVVDNDVSEKAAPTSAPPGRVIGSNYETPDERKQRQLLIVRQSSIANALELLKNVPPDGDYGVQEVLTIAQEFVDFVYGNTFEMDAEAERISQE